MVSEVYGVIAMKNSREALEKVEIMLNWLGSCVADTGKQGKGFVSIHNICGDLNKGYIPRNPMKQNFGGSSYPL